MLAFSVAHQLQVIQKKTVFSSRFKIHFDTFGRDVTSMVGGVCARVTGESEPHGRKRRRLRAWYRKYRSLPSPSSPLLLDAWFRVLRSGYSLIRPKDAHRLSLRTYFRRGIVLQKYPLTQSCMHVCPPGHPDLRYPPGGGWTSKIYPASRPRGWTPGDCGVDGTWSSGMWAFRFDLATAGAFPDHKRSKVKQFPST